MLVRLSADTPRMPAFTKSFVDSFMASNDFSLHQEGSTAAEHKISQLWSISGRILHQLLPLILRHLEADANFFGGRDKG